MATDPKNDGEGAASEPPKTTEETASTTTPEETTKEVGDEVFKNKKSRSRGTKAAPTSSSSVPRSGGKAPAKKAPKGVKAAPTKSRGGIPDAALGTPQHTTVLLKQLLKSMKHQTSNGAK